MSTPSEAIEALRPNQRLQIMDLVAEAGIDVSPWKTRADGSAVDNPRANPNFCYDWAFGGNGKPTLLCVWHENLEVVAGTVVCADNYQELARKLEDAASKRLTPQKVRNRAATQARRAWEFDRKLQRAFRDDKYLRVVLLEGEQRDDRLPGNDASNVRFRRLDSEPWHVASYDGSGAFRLVRGPLPEPHSREAVEVASEIPTLSIDVLTDALTIIESSISGAQREMLLGHAIADQNTLSAAEISALGMYRDFAQAMKDYRQIGQQIAEAANLPETADPICLLSRVAASASPADTRYTLRPAVVQALESLGMLRLPSTDSVAYDVFAATLAESPELANETPTSRIALVEARLGQGAYRRRMLRWWGSACSVTGCNVEQALVASHAIPWSESSSRERLDHFNGLLLTGTLDRLFDTGLIGFSSDGTLLVSSRLSTEQGVSLGLVQGMRLRKIDARMLRYLEAHRKQYGIPPLLLTPS